MNVHYLVVKQNQCATCGGFGGVEHPAWRCYHSTHPDGGDIAVVMADYGYSEIPPEEIKCSKCDGTGIERVEVPLEEALRELGLIILATEDDYCMFAELAREYSAEPAKGLMQRVWPQIK